MKFTHLTDDTFDDFLKDRDVPVVVSFHAPWCADCKRIQRTLDDLPERYPDLAFADVDTEEAMETAARFDIRGIPTLLVFEDGHMVDRLYSREAKWPQEIESFITDLAGEAAASATEQSSAG